MLEAAQSTQQTTREPSIAAPSISLPKGGGAIRGIGEKFAANPVTGTGSMSVPIQTSPGRSGFGPQLSLSYDSGAGNGPFGFGWSLSLPSITRKTDKGVPRYLDAQDSDVFILSGAEDLVPVFRRDATGELVHDQARKLTIHEDTRDGFAIRRYRPRVEGLFARIERWTRQSDGDVHWRSISRDNVTTLYGKTLESRVVDPADDSRVFSWLVCASYDDKGNALVYEYERENSDNVVTDVQGRPTAFARERNRGGSRSANTYVKRIKYGNRAPNRDANWKATDPTQLNGWLFEVVLDYDEGHYQELPEDSEQRRFVRAELARKQPWTVRQDPFSTYRPGFEVRTYRLCRRVLMFHHFPDELGVADYLVRSTEFGYAQSPVASFITSVTQSGYARRDDGTFLKRSFPSLEFEYSEARLGDDVREIAPKSLENLPLGVDGGTYQWVDLDGEGLSGILTEQAGAWFYKRNLSANTIVRDNGTERAVPRFAPLERVPTRPAAILTGGNAQFLDLAGDGRLDLVDFGDHPPGFYERDANEWASFRPFLSWPTLDTRDPNLKFVDLDGDGHADVLITEHEVMTWHASLGEEGFGPAVRVGKPLDEEIGPRLVFADGTQSIHLADLSGDGLTDLVRIRNGDVSYWPNLGHGRFGAKITMDDPPLFDHPDRFDQRRLRLADIDGSGTTDLLYLGSAGVDVYRNQCGNAWGKAERLASFPQIENASSVVATDLLGNGTACLVWSSPLPAHAGAPMRYVDLMDGKKPHLLRCVRNNLGAETVITYAASTKFYLKDKERGKPWVTRLPFPVHVVERVETYDHVSRSLFITRYEYHHGYFDGDEREFRGFGMVEQRDTEEFEALRGGALRPAANIDASSHVPTVLTKTWFHTGAYIDRRHVSDFFAGLSDGDDLGEYYREAGLSKAQARELLLDDTDMPDGLTLDVEREACRALKGSMLRREVYALDGPPKENLPYAVTEQSFAIRLLQPRAAQRHAVFLAHPRESINFQYERSLMPTLNGQIVDDVTAAEDPNVTWLADPRVAHELTLEVDDFGNVRKSATVGYGRRFGDLHLPSQQDRDTQQHPLVTYNEILVTNAINLADDHRAPLPCESRMYELTGYVRAGLTSRLKSSDLVRSDAQNTRSLISVFDGELRYEEKPTNGKQRRPIEVVRTLFRPDDLGVAANDSLTLLPLGEAGSLALPGQTYRLAFTPELAAAVYGGRVTATLLQDEGGYVHCEGDARWWTPSGRTFYSPGTSGSPDQELTYARDHFFLMHRHRDPFHTSARSTEAFVSYDIYNLLPVETRDGAGNRLTVGERHVDPSQPLVRNGHDYRVLQPRFVMDPNRNCSAVAFDAIGLVVGTALMGKPEDDPVVGDRLAATFRADLTRAEVNELLADPTGKAARTLLSDASTRVVYDFPGGADESDTRSWSPAVAVTLARETHASEGLSAGALRTQVSLSYSDGFGRVIQTKTGAGSGPVPKRGLAGEIVIGPDRRPEMTSDARPRWIVSGWSVFNNKGKPVRRYEPFFSDTPAFEFGPRLGVSPVLFYDPIDRVVATLHPNRTWEKVAFDAWRQDTWDVNDTVLIAAPSADPQAGSFIGRLQTSEHTPTWYDLRTDVAKALAEWPAVDAAGNHLDENEKRRASEKNAAQKAAQHARTPTVTHLDVLGRTFLTMAHNRTRYSDASPAEAPKEEWQCTRTLFDVEGNEREVRDATEQDSDQLGRVVMRYDYDMLANRVHQAGMDTGERWMLDDVTGKPIRSWNSRGHALRTQYDALRRTSCSFVAGANSDDPNFEVLTECLVYGEQHPQALSRNLLGRVYLHLDQAGAMTNEAYDFKGNLLRSSRRLTRAYKEMTNWAAFSAALPTDLTAKFDLALLDASVTPLLGPEPFESATTFDALSRPVSVVMPHTAAMPRTTLRYGYDETSLLERVEANLRDARQNGSSVWTPIVSDIDYDARGQRTLIDFGNGIRTTLKYDPQTFRLVQLMSRRDAGAFPDDCPHPPQADWPGCHLQDLSYAYDPVGNITQIRDDAQQTLYFLNRRIDPSADYVYDAVYRLIEATGREHLGLVGTSAARSSHTDMGVVTFSANDGTAVGRYLEQYVYDSVGNIKEVRHQGSDSSHRWTRRYAYVDSSLIEPAKYSNRLSSAATGAFTETYSAGANGYDAHGNMLRMPHLPAMYWDYKDQLGAIQRQTVVADDHEGDLPQGAHTWFVYDANGQRVRKVTEFATGEVKEERTYLGGFEIYRRHSTGAFARETVHIMDGARRVALVETRTQGTEPGAPTQLVRFQFDNHLGSAIVECDDGANVISYEEYYPYGSTSLRAARPQLEAPKRYRYAGKERDDESGLYYFGARYYAPWLGRWTKPDPLYLKDATNVYMYALNNPIIAKDLTGGPVWLIPVVIYLGWRALESAAETGIEAGIAKATGDESFSTGGTFLKNMAVNSVIGVIPGAPEAKIGTKAAIYGAKLAIRTTGDATLDTLQGKGTFQENLEKSALGNVGGDVAGSLLKKGGKALVEKVKGAADEATASIAPGLGEQLIKEEKRSGLKVDLAGQQHGHKIDYRKGSGTDVQSAHMVNSSSVSDISDYVRDRAVTVLLPTKQHKAFDDAWKKWARQRLASAKPGEEVKVTVAEWERVLNEAAESVPELQGRTAETMSFMIRTELYQSLGLKPDQLIRLPFSQ